MLLIAYLAKWFIGIAVGIYFNDRRTGISIHQAKIGLSVFLVIASLIIFLSDQKSYLLITDLTASFIVFFGGVWLGEFVHIKLMNRFMLRKKVEKANTIKIIQEFIHEADRVATGKSTKEFLDSKLYYTASHLNYKYNEYRFMKPKGLCIEWNKLKEACILLAQTSINVAENPEYYFKYRKLSKQLLVIADETMETVQKELESEVNRSFGVLAVPLKDQVQQSK